MDWLYAGHGFFQCVRHCEATNGRHARLGLPEDAAMNHADNFQKLGFRKWYERTLLSSHAHMVLAVFSVIGLLASFEAFRGAEPSQQFVNVMFVMVCAWIGHWALRRYLFLLNRAEEAANQASCSQCGDYGRFQVVMREHDGAGVRCRKCGHPWKISLGR